MKLNGAKIDDLRCLHKKLIIVKCEQVHQHDVAKKFNLWKLLKQIETGLNYMFRKF